MIKVIIFTFGLMVLNNLVKIHMKSDIIEQAILDELKIIK